MVESALRGPEASTDPFHLAPYVDQSLRAPSGPPRLPPAAWNRNGPTRILQHTRESVRLHRISAIYHELPIRGCNRLGKDLFLHFTCNLFVAYNSVVIADMDKVFKALADPSRRQLLDRLHANNGQTLGELCQDLDMTRQAVTKHLAVLEAANLVATIWRGREKLHYLNPVPIGELYERWIGKYERHRVRALHDLKKALEEEHHG